MGHKLDMSKLADKKQKEKTKLDAIAEARSDTSKKTTVSALAARFELIEKIIGI